MFLLYLIYRHLQKIFAKSYDVLYHYLQGNSRKNELYIAKHIDFFQTQFELGVSIQMISTYRKISDGIIDFLLNIF